MTRDVESPTHGVIPRYAGHIRNAGYNFTPRVVSGGTSNGIDVKILQRVLTGIGINLVGMFSANYECRINII